MRWGKAFVLFCSAALVAGGLLLLMGMNFSPRKQSALNGRAKGVSGLGVAAVGNADNGYVTTARRHPVVDNGAYKDRFGGMGTKGEVSEGAVGIDSLRYLIAWNFSDLPPPEKSKFYRETPLENGKLLREYLIHAADRVIEAAPGVFFPARRFLFV